MDLRRLSRRVTAVAGIVAPVLFAALLVVLGSLEPGYSHRTLTMSVLGGVGGRRGSAFNVGISLVGVPLLLRLPPQEGSSASVCYQPA